MFRLPRGREREGAVLCAGCLLFAVAFMACTGPDPVLRRGFFFWRTTFALSAAERAVLAEHRITRLYVRFFDVARDPANHRPAPLARITFPEPWPQGIEAVPVVYLKNEVLGNTEEAEELAAKVWALLSVTAREAGVGFAELMVDCDWTDSTRAGFFAFCRALRSAAGEVAVTATIRLHQIEYAGRTGVPPVERGTLMFYNVGRISAEPGPSSIFNAADAARYTAALATYPLPLDVALPIFSWLVHGRDGRVVGLLEKPDPDVRETTRFLRHEADDLWLATAPAFFRGTYLRQGDTLVREAVTPAVARTAAAMLAERLPRGGDRTVALFDLDERNLQRFSRTDLEALFSLARDTAATPARSSAP